MVEAILIGLVAGGVLWNGLRYGRARLQEWRDAAVACGLQVVEISSPLLKLRLVARAGPLEIRFELRHGRDYSTWVVVTGPLGFYGVRICREQNQPRGLREIEIGDDRFDNEFWVEGPPQLVGLLNAETRRLLLRVNSWRRIEIADGELRVGTSDKDLPDLLPHLLEIAKRFAQRADVVPLLAESANRDPVAKVRLQNLLYLVREFPKDPRTIEALRAACSDRSPQVRLRAARELGAEGRKVLAELAESVEDDATSAQAVSILGRDLGFERLRAILILALRRRRIETARACLEELGRCGEAAVPTLTKVLAREKAELAVAAARALGWTGSATAEPPLILALARANTDLQVAAAIALGHVGSAASVLPLKETAERGSRDLNLRQVARQALAKVKSRLQGASPGQLSLAGAELGQLSLAQAEAGQLSLATDSTGQLSLRDAEEKLK